MISRVTWHSCPEASFNPSGSLLARISDALLAQHLEQGYRAWNILKYFSISHNKGESNSKSKRKKMTYYKMVGWNSELKQNCYIKFQWVFLFPSVCIRYSPISSVARDMWYGMLGGGHVFHSLGFHFCGFSALRDTLSLPSFTVLLFLPSKKKLTCYKVCHLHLRIHCNSLVGREKRLLK